MKYAMYVLVRQDISLEQQLVQLGHATAEAGRSSYNEDHGIASLIVLSVKDKDALYKARDYLSHRQVEHSLFFEPDFDMGHSALCTRPLNTDERKMMRKWPLWKLNRATNS